MRSFDLSATWVRETLLPSLAGFLTAGWLANRRWFASKTRRIERIELLDHALVPHEEKALFLAVCETSYDKGDSDQYILIFGLARNLPTGCESLLQVVSGRGHACHLYDLNGDADLVRQLIQLITSGVEMRTTSGRLIGELIAPFDADLAALQVTVLGREQSNTNLRIGERYLLKIFRRYVPGPNPDYEVGRFLTRRVRFPHVPQMVGALHYALGDAMPMTLAQVQGWVANEGDAWQRTVAHFASMLREGHGSAETAMDFTLLGRRTGELHLTLASATDDPAFAPEEMTKADLLSLVQQMHDRLDESLQVLRNQLLNLSEANKDLARKLLANANPLRKRIQVPELSATVPKIRVHGDYHLGQVLCTPDGDFVIVDFEGEPARPLAERRAKHCPLKDVAGMLRSFDYAAQAALRGLAASVFEASAISTAERFADQASRQFLNGYYAALDSATVLPRDVNLRNQLLNLFVLDKALYELLYEANNRPDWIAIPLTGLIRYASGVQV